MSLAAVRGLTTATAATADHAIAAVWNPHATKRISLLELAIFAAAAPGAAAGFYLRRISVRGTAAAAAAPGIPNSYQGDTAPVSGWALDLGAYTVQPTLAAGAGIGYGFVFAAVAASGIVLPLRGIEIPPGAGLALLNRAAIAVPACEISATVTE